MNEPGCETKKMRSPCKAEPDGIACYRLYLVLSFIWHRRVLTDKMYNISLHYMAFSPCKFHYYKKHNPCTNKQDDCLHGGSTCIIIV